MCLFAHKTHSRIHSLTHSPTHLPTHSLIHSFPTFQEHFLIRKISIWIFVSSEMCFASCMSSVDICLMTQHSFTNSLDYGEELKIFCGKTTHTKWCCKPAAGGGEYSQLYEISHYYVIKLWYLRNVAVCQLARWRLRCQLVGGRWDVNFSARMFD